MVEMMVSNLELIKLPEEVGADLDTCVLLRLLENVDLEVCSKDFGTCKGENCIFSLSPNLDVASVKASINVFKKDDQDQRLFVGRYDLHLAEIFQKLLKIQALPKMSNTASQTHDLTTASGVSSLLNESIEKTSKASVKSLKSESIMADPNTEPTSETIKGLFPLFNHDDDNIGFIVLTLRISCYGNMITHPIIGSDSCQNYSSPDLYQLCAYKRSKDTESESSVSCVCQEVCSVCSDQTKMQSSEETICKHHPSPVSSCVCSGSKDYDEYIQEVNGNSLTIRIPKGALMKAIALEPTDKFCRSASKGEVIKYSRNHDNVDFPLT